MYACMHVCMYEMPVYLKMSMYTETVMYRYLYMYAFMHTSMKYMCMHVYLHMYMYMQIYTYIYIYTCSCRGCCMPSLLLSVAGRRLLAIPHVLRGEPAGCGRVLHVLRLCLVVFRVAGGGSVGRMCIDVCM